MYYHIIFSTKLRIPYIHPNWMPLLHAYMAGIVKKLDGVPYEIGGVKDHVHLLVKLNQHHKIKDFLRELKKSSSAWVHTDISVREFAWQEGYAAFTVSPFDQTNIKSYIRNQEEHHRNLPYVDELRSILERAGVKYDPRYLE